MALIVDVKVNNTLIYRLTAERFPDTKPKGLNPYRIKLFDNENTKLYEGMTAHQYEDGAVRLVQRMAQEICNSSTTTRKD